ncbi:ABC transporter permease [Pinibacter aurantiacus]|uniref:ABC transporter permease n=1 Tax=Pinibacter aurantiacus TaxID=2851599 RepID=A0A9E2W2T7_9BACT|nr:ABC transporter permease [Pinibacter aurantiacus]MBV4357690.1 ABC transporter permease [Pinibacter aurantiacus]
MEINIPKSSTVFSALLRADFTTQWRNRRSAVLALLIPVIILISWKGIIVKYGGAFVLSSSIALGLVAIGLMGYTNSVARDRDKGIFQRLRVAPIPSWAIMISRLTVQLTMILIVTICVFITGYYVDGIHLSAVGYLLTVISALVGGAVYLSLGQMIVGLIKNPETVNSTTRLVYFVFIITGMIGGLGFLGDIAQKLARWSPYGTVQTMLAGSLQPDLWHNETTMALLVTLGYTLFFAFMGIKKFKWNTR